MRASIDGVVREAIIAACLTAVMILIFLGSWRSTLIIAVSIPLSILTSLLMLSALGETINIMTLGGLALAVGILVDDATVEIENINRNLGAGEGDRAGDSGWRRADCRSRAGGDDFHLHRLRADVLSERRGASICLCRWPKPWSSPCWRRICCRARWCRRWRSICCREVDASEHERKQKSRNPFTRFQLGFEHYFERFRLGYRRMLELCIHHAGLFMIIFFVFTMGSAALLYPYLGEDFFPSVDSGQFKLHVRAQTGTRIEDTAAVVRPDRQHDSAVDSER